MAQPIAVVDAFTSEPYRGNPAGICVLPAAASDAWMQSVAIEMNHAETAFLVRRGASNHDGYHLRWFTPGGEVDLCGHATLASAHYLWETNALAAEEQARFHTRSGLLTADRILLHGTAWIELDFPSEPVVATAAPEGLAAMLGAEPIFVGRNRMDFLVDLKDESTVRNLRPDFKRIEALSSEASLRGIIVTATGSGEAEIVSRCFFPRFHIDEDPVTGSAHCALAPYWIERLGKSEIVAYQASARGGWLRLRLAGDRVKLRGQAVTTLRGELAHDPR
ncbi:MAG TPA: PhzF family phenazine biosynthesis protein [Acidobacteriaceae bacterium]|nr:PhzF family phenazine biosynthesis protein [Acidobacteriaceae bacterium]